MDKRVIIERALLETRREGIEDLIEWMYGNGYFEAPASGGNHNCFVGGLADHSYNVYFNALHIAHSLLDENEYDEMEESISLVALLHDLGKCGNYGKPMYVDNILKTGQSKSKPFKTNPELLYIDHATRSIQIASRFIELTEEEVLAIRYHDGLYEPANYGLKGNETKLVMILHWADMWSSRFDEKRGNEE